MVRCCLLSSLTAHPHAIQRLPSSDRRTVQVRGGTSESIDSFARMTLDNASVATSGTKKPKKGFVKSVKSVAKGLSFKRKKKRPDDESVLSLALDNGANSTAAKSTAGGVPQLNNARRKPTDSTAKPLHLFVLLMDPTSRRFELLQLEFDANKATVGDIQHQIKNSATEKTLRDMVYDGVCDRTGVEMIASMKLLRFCNGGDVVMAMPKGMTGKETAKLAKPILNDPKVENMASVLFQLFVAIVFDFLLSCWFMSISNDGNH